MIAEDEKHEKEIIEDRLDFIIQRQQGNGRWGHFRTYKTPLSAVGTCAEYRKLYPDKVFRVLKERRRITAETWTTVVGGEE